MSLKSPFWVLFQCNKQKNRIFDIIFFGGDSIEFPLKDVQLPRKTQKGSKQPLRRSPGKLINIDQSSSEPGPSKKSSTLKAQSSTQYSDGGSSFKEMANNVSKGFRSGLFLRRYFVLESMKFFQKTFNKTKNVIKTVISCDIHNKPT